MLSFEVISSFLTLTFLEVVLGIDNIIFISILANRFPEEQRSKLMKTGLFLAMFVRILLLLGITWLIKMQEPLFVIHSQFFSSEVSLQALILFGGGIFLLYKSTKEIFHKTEDISGVETKQKSDGINKFSKALIQILLIDVVFSFDSILTAVGMTNGVDYALYIMISAIIISIIIMISFAMPISAFINKHLSLQILGLSFLLLIGFLLISEAAHISDTLILGKSIGNIPKGYLYFSIAFSLGVEMVNMKIRSKSK